MGLGALLAAWAAAASAAEVAVSVSDESGAPVAEAVVFVQDAGGKTFPAPDEPALMDQVEQEFVPHLLPVVAGTKVRFPNKDDIHHHIYSFSGAKTFELPLYKGEPADPVVFDKPGVVKLGCNIHDWMSGVILVLPTPWFAVTGADGKAKVKVPDGKTAELFVFHERLKGKVDETKKTAALAGPMPSAAWKVALKPERKKKRSSAGYK